MVRRRNQLTCICIRCGVQTLTQAEMVHHMEYHAESEYIEISDGEDHVDIPLQTVIDEAIEESFKLRNNVKKTLWEKYRAGSSYHKVHFCGICRSIKPSVLPLPSKAAMARHYLFYHSKNSHKCSLCDDQFRHSYQINLHKMFKHKLNFNFIKFVIL